MQEVKLRKRLVGDFIEISVYDIDPILAHPILEEAYLEALRLEKIFNFYDKKSELSLLNMKRSLSVSVDLLFVIRLALKFSAISDGKYDVSLGKNFLQRKSSLPLTKLNSSYKDIKVIKNIITLSHPDVLIDLGSIAKGYIVDKVVEFLIKQGIENGYVDARGDIRFFGNYEETVEIQHPRQKGKSFLPFKIKNLSIATSGDYNQFYGKEKESHIIGQEEIISATVVAPTALEADVFASLLYLVDDKKRRSVLKSNEYIKAILIDKDLNRKDYNGFSSLLIK